MKNGKQQKRETASDVTPEEERTIDPGAAQQTPSAAADGQPEEDPVAALERERDELREQYQRALAEQENARKRHQRQMQEQRQYSVSELARELLEVVDNLQRALAGVRPEEGNDPLVAGVRLVEEQLLKTLCNHGVRPIEACGQPFDPMLHQAVMEVETDEVEPGTITEELARGYTLGDRLLREAAVRVAKALSKTKESEGEEPIVE
ncbi:MAG: nucleotide exchange factor GrpE [Planctomycetota bacterium]